MLVDVSVKKVPYSPELLIELRKNHNLSQKELADKSGLHHRTIQQYEWNKTVPTEAALMKLGRVFNVLFYADWEHERPLPQRD